MIMAEESELELCSGFGQKKVRCDSLLYYPYRRRNFTRFFECLSCAKIPDNTDIIYLKINFYAALF